jgi:hypothetical protein
MMIEKQIVLPRILGPVQAMRPGELRHDRNDADESRIGRTGER